MAEHTPVEIVRHASTLSILWGVLLIVFGILAVGSPFLAAVAVNVVIAWLIILAGVVHVILAFHAHRAGRLIWKLLVGLAYLFFGAYLIMHPVLGVATLTLVLASLFLIEGILDIVLFFQPFPAKVSPQSRRKKLILCIDDHQPGVRARKLILEAAGYRVLTANSGTIGLRLLRRHRVHFVVLDYRMPQMDGE